ncbi:hypothetical protein CKO36_03580 [Rhabdochromatium marinum]|nr:hypothetical protein [Rhabdochromatium marinum]
MRCAYLVCGLLVWLLPAMGMAGPLFPSPAREILLNGRPAPMTSMIQGALSNRHQEHLWVTPDFGLHVLIAGSKRLQRGLNVFSSQDLGWSWTPTLEISATGARPKADLLYQNGRLHLLYPAVDASLMYATAVQAGDGAWQLEASQVLIPATESFRAQRATLAFDVMGRLWVAFTELNAQTGQSRIRVGLRSEDDVFRWLDTDFGRFSRSERKSARILTLGTSMVLLYTDGGSAHSSKYRLNLSYCPMLEDPETWNHVQLFDYTADDGLKDRHGAHFNAVVDSMQQVQMVTVSNGKLLHLRWSPLDPLGAVRIRRLGASSPYMQIATTADGRLYIASSANPRPYHDVVRLLRSDDNGSSFTFDRYLLFEPEHNLGKARLEMPASLPWGFPADFPPVLRQVETAQGTFTFVLFLD